MYGMWRWHNNNNSIYTQPQINIIMLYRCRLAFFYGSCAFLSMNVKKKTTLYSVLYKYIKHNRCVLALKIWNNWCYSEERIWRYFSHTNVFTDLRKCGKFNKYLQWICVRSLAVQCTYTQHTKILWLKENNRLVWNAKLYFILLTYYVKVHEENGTANNYYF